MSEPRPPTPPLVHDVAALERTALAWERTAFSLAAVGALLLKLSGGGVLLQAGGVAMVVVAGAIVLVMVPLGYRRARARVDPQEPAAPFTRPDRWRPVVMLGTTVLVTLAAVLVALDVWVTGAS